MVATIAQASRRTGRGARGRAGPSPSPIRTQVITVTASSALASRKCPATVHGLSPAQTVMPPRTALPSTIQNCDQASRVSLRRRGFIELTATIAQPTAADRTYVSIRLPNSIAPCSPCSGVANRLSSVHLGQVSQPRPEPVSRTAPPVTMMRTLIMTAESAARLTILVDGVQRLAMAEMGVSTRTIVGGGLCTFSRGVGSCLLPGKIPYGGPPRATPSGRTSPPRPAPAPPTRPGSRPGPTAATRRAGGRPAAPPRAPRWAAAPAPTAPRPGTCPAAR